MDEKNVLTALFDELDIHAATEGRVNPAALRKLLAARRIRTPLLPPSPGNPQLFWFGNVLEIDVVSQVSELGISPSSLRDPLLWLGRAITHMDEDRVLVWSSPTALPSVVKAEQISHVLSTAAGAMVTINLKHRIARLVELLGPRVLARTRSVHDRADLLSILEEAWRSDDRAQQLVREVFSLV